MDGYVRIICSKRRRRPAGRRPTRSPAGASGDRPACRRINWRNIYFIQYLLSHIENIKWYSYACMRCTTVVVVELSCSRVISCQLYLPSLISWSLLKYIYIRVASVCIFLSIYSLRLIKNVRCFGFFY